MSVSRSLLDWRSRMRAWFTRTRVPPEGPARNQIRADSQSLGFAVDLCHVIQEELRTERAVRLTLLDVGARTACGSNLMAQVFHPGSYSQIKLDVTALDIDPTHQEEARARYPDVRYRLEDIHSLRDSYDVVTCSHTLEHMDDPGTFLERLRGIAKRLVIIAAPYGEVLDGSAPNPSNHKFTFDEEFFSAYPPSRLSVYRSPHWSASDCFVAVYGPTLPDTSPSPQVIP